MSVDPFVFSTPPSIFLPFIISYFASALRLVDPALGALGVPATLVTGPAGVVD